MKTLREFLEESNVNEAISISSGQAIKYFKLIQKGLKAKKFEVSKHIGDMWIVKFSDAKEFGEVTLAVSGTSIVGYAYGEDEGFYEIPASIKSIKDLYKQARILKNTKGKAKPLMTLAKSTDNKVPVDGSEIVISNSKYTAVKEGKLLRITAVRDIPGVVKEGQEGGLIEKESNLSSDGDCWVGDDAIVSGNAQVFDNARVYESAVVIADARVYGNAKVSGNAEVSENAEVYVKAEVYDDAQVSGNAEVYNNAQVYGDALVADNAGVSENARVYGNARVTGNARVFGNSSVFDDAEVYGRARVSGSAKVYFSAEIHGNAKVYGDVIVSRTAEVTDNAEVYDKASILGNSVIDGTAKIGGKSKIRNQNISTGVHK